MRQPKDIDHLSHSSIRKFLECPKSWAAHYLEERESVPSTAMFKGIAVDRVATANWNQKRKSGEDMPIKDAEEIAVAAYRERVDFYGVDGIDWGDDSDGAAVDATVKMTRCHMIEHAPLFSPVDTQVRVARKLNDGREFVGFMDALCEDGTVIDVKTGGRAMAANDAKRDYQPSAYAFALGRPLDFIYARVINGKKETIGELVETKRNEYAIQQYEETVNAVSLAIDVGAYPAHPGYYCDHCPIKARCIEAIST